MALIQAKVEGIRLGVAAPKVKMMEGRMGCTDSSMW